MRQALGDGRNLRASSRADDFSRGVDHSRGDDRSRGEDRSRGDDPSRRDDSSRGDDRTRGNDSRRGRDRSNEGESSAGHRVDQWQYDRSRGQGSTRAHDGSNEGEPAYRMYADDSSWIHREGYAGDRVDQWQYDDQERAPLALDLQSIEGAASNASTNIPGLGHDGGQPSIGFYMMGSRVVWEVPTVARTQDDDAAVAVARVADTTHPRIFDLEYFRNWGRLHGWADTYKQHNMALKFFRDTSEEIMWTHVNFTNDASDMMGTIMHFKGTDYEFDRQTLIPWT